MGDEIKVLTDEELAEILNKAKHQDDLEEESQDWFQRQSRIIKQKNAERLQERVETALVPESMLEQFDALRGISDKYDTLWFELKEAIKKQELHYTSTLEALKMLQQANLQLMEEKKLREERDEDDE